MAARAPMSTATPTMPSSSAPNLTPRTRSSRVMKCATKSVNRGVVAFRIEARPEAIWVWPQKIRPKGTRLFIRPIAAKLRHGVPARNSSLPAMARTTLSATAAKATRQKTTDSGGSSANATLAKKNEPPHRMDSDNNQIHIRRLMTAACRLEGGRSIRRPPAIASCVGGLLLLALDLNLCPSVPQARSCG